MASALITSWQIDGETMEIVRDFIFLGSKITVDGDCSHEIKRSLLLGRKAMINLDSILKSRAITLLAKVMRKEAWHTQRRDQASGNPLFLSIYPKTRVCFMLSPISLREGVNVQLQGNKNSWG